MKKLLFLLPLITCLAAGAKDIEVKRDNTALRKGPASYYTVLEKIPAKTKVQELKLAEGWIQVNYKTLSGYISSSSIDDKKLNNDPFAGVTVRPGNMSASDHAVSAGVKGFARQFAGSVDFVPDAGFMQLATDYSLDIASFNAYLNVIYSNQDPAIFRNKALLPQNDLPDYFTDAQEGFGLAVAARIASSGLDRTPSVNNWVRNTGQLIVNAAYPSDITYRFFVLDLAIPNAWACPGGFIFITSGMIKLLQSDAELAFILAHEIAHVSKFHGLLEMKKRENQIAAQSVFDELDAELPDAYDEDAKLTEKELESEIKDMFEYLVNGRMQEYEKEADKLGLAFMAQAGFNPSSAKNILKRIQTVAFSPISSNQHYNQQNISERLDWLDRELKQYDLSKDKWLPERMSVK